jgi:glutaredoxin
MRIAYTLEETDLEALMIQLTLWQSERVRTGPVWRHLAFNMLLGIAAGVLVLPLWIVLIHQRWALYPCAVGLAVVAATAIQRFKVPRRLPLSGILRWRLRRQVRRSRARSVLGPIEIALGDGGLAKKNQTGEANIPWSEVRAVLESPSLVTLVLPGNRVLIAPRRAFPDEESARAFRAEVERRAGKPAVAVPEAPLLSRRALDPGLRARSRRKVLWLALAISLVALAVLRGPVWYYDPRRHHGPNQVTVYSTSWCPACKRLRICLRERGVPFDERDIETAERAGMEYWALDGEGVPLTLAGQEIARGMSQAELQPALRRAGYEVDCWSASPNAPEETSPSGSRPR